MFYNLPTSLYCESDCILAHAGDIASFGKAAYIITGKSSSKRNGSLDDIVNVLKKYSIEFKIFDNVEENPSVENVMEAVAYCGDFTPDFVIGIGGGSPLDASKAVSLMLANIGSDSSLLYNGIKADYLPIVTVPTTCGTGSEITPYSVLTNHIQKTKSSIPHKIYPALALVDPVYLEAAPVNIIRNTAVDALGHLIESYIHSKATTLSRMFSEKGLRMWRNITSYIKNDSFTAKQYEELILASAIAGMAISHTGTSLPHRMSYHFTYQDSIPHGVAVGAFLAAYIMYSDNNEQKYVLETLGMSSCDELRNFIRSVTETITIPEADLHECIEFVISNKSKLASCPYEVDYEIVKKMYEYSVIIK